MNPDISFCPPRSELSDYLLGEVGTAQETLIDQHMEQCSTCERMLHEIELDTLKKLGFRPGKNVALEYRQQPEVPDGLIRKLESLVADPLDLTQDSASSWASDELLVGKTLGNYEIQKLIGRGGMGCVYQAKHLHLNRLVAIKVLPNNKLQDPAALERFRREIEAVAKLEHPNVVQATDAGDVNDPQVGVIHFLAMKLIHGPNLSEVVRDSGPLSIANACQCVQQIASALQAAHEHQMVHRDIKPSNIMLDADGQTRMLDLGLALLRRTPSDDSTEHDDVTSAGTIVGTIDYMAPEQATSSHDVDIRADIYSLGCTLFYLLTGNPPFKSIGDSNQLRALMRHLNDPIPNIHELRPDVPLELSKLITEMLGKKPEERPAQPAEIVRRLAPFIGEEELVQPVAKPAGLPNRVSRLLIATGFLGAVFLFGLTIFVATDKGDVVIRVADNIQDQVTVNVIREDRPLIKDWIVTSHDHSRSIGTGPIEVQIQGPGSRGLNIVFNGGKAEVMRGEQLLVSIEKAPASATDARFDSDSPKSIATDRVRPEADALPQWPKGEGWLDGEVVAGLCSHPTVLANAQRWNMIRECAISTIWDMDWSPDGKWLAVAGKGDPWLRIFRLTEDSSLVLAKVLKSECWAIKRCRFSPNSRRLAIKGLVDGWPNSFIEIWETESWTREVHLRDRKIIRAPNDFQWGDDSSTLWGCSNDAIWRVDQQGNLATVIERQSDEASFLRLQVAESIQRLFGLSENGTLTVYTLLGKKIQSLQTHKPLESELLLSPDQTHLYLQGTTQAGNHRLWKVEAAGLSAAEIESNLHGNALADYPSSAGDWSAENQLAVCGTNGYNHATVYLWQHQSGTWSSRTRFSLPRRQFGTGIGTGEIAWHPSKDLIVIGTNGFLGLVRPSDGKVIYWLGLAENLGQNMHPSSISAEDGITLAFPDGQIFQTSLDGKSTTQLPEVPLCSFAARLNDQYSVFDCGFFNNDPSRELSLRNTSTGEIKFRSKGIFSHASLQGRWLSYLTSHHSANADQRYAFTAWDPVSSDRWERTADAPLKNYAWSRSGETLALVTGAQQLEFYSSEGTRVQTSVGLPDMAVRSMQWSRDDRHVVVQTDKQILLLRVKDSELLWKIQRPAGTKNGVWFSPEGDIVRCDRKSFHFHSAANGSPLLLQKRQVRSRC